jgi:hypothetical protein
MANLFQVLVLMAAPAAIPATMGYFNRRADRRFAQLDAARSSDRHGPAVPARTSSASQLFAPTYRIFLTR